MYRNGLNELIWDSDRLDTRPTRLGFHFISTGNAHSLTEPMQSEYSIYFLQSFKHEGFKFFFQDFIGKILTKIGKIQPIFGLGMRPIFGCKNCQIKSLGFYKNRLDMSVFFKNPWMFLKIHFAENSCVFRYDTGVPLHLTGLITLLYHTFAMNSHALVAYTRLTLPYVYIMFQATTAVTAVLNVIWSVFLLKLKFC